MTTTPKVEALDTFGVDSSEPPRTLPFAWRDSTVEMGPFEIPASAPTSVPFTWNTTTTRGRTS